MSVWYIASVPLWLASGASLVIGFLILMVGTGDERKQPLAWWQELIQMLFAVILVASGSGWLYLAARLAGN